MPYPNTFCRCVRFNCYAKDARNIFASTPRLHVLVWYKVKYVAGILCKYWHGSANEWDVGSRKRIAHIHLRCLMFQNRVDDLPMWRWCFVRFNLTQILNVHAPFECKDLNEKSKFSTRLNYTTNSVFFQHFEDRCWWSKINNTITIVIYWNVKLKWMRFTFVHSVDRLDTFNYLQCSRDFWFKFKFFDSIFRIYLELTMIQLDFFLLKS